MGWLTPLGNPFPNTPKWVAAVEMIRLAANRDRLPKSTKEISKYCRNEGERRKILAPLPGPIRSEGFGIQSQGGSSRLREKGR